MTHPGPVMDADALQDLAASIALEQPAASLEHPFGPTWDVFKVAGLVFALITDEPGRRIINLKAEPEECRALCEQFDSITPGYHMNKKHWISLSAGEGIDAELVRELVLGSYRLVVAKLPRSRRPVDPEAWGLA